MLHEIQNPDQLNALLGDIRQAVATHNYDVTDSGMVVFDNRVGVQAGGQYHTRTLRHELVQQAIEDNDPEQEAYWRQWLFNSGTVHTGNGFMTVEDSRDRNLIPTLGLNYLLDVILGNTIKKSAWYFGAFTSNSAPAASWGPDWGKTAGGSATEITSAQMVTQTTRPAATFGDAAASGVLASSDATRITLAEGVSGLALYGATLNSSSAIAYSGTSEILLSAVRFASTKSGLGAGDKVDLEYEITATST